jgi:hypothetical protein
MVLMGGNMKKAKELWALAKVHRKISTAIVVAIVVIYFLVN